MTIAWFAAGVVVGWVTMLVLLVYVGRQARARLASKRSTPTRLECEVCGITTESWESAKQHAVGSHSAITEKTWVDVIREVE